ncbi:hypothetical protein MAR_011463 [Mya arenaria]|uniref:Uncharacterized protein n=1 Tax=Mya arenaria TaxID=6604 RepID=A0ABY7FXZ0_MYAAR|nr:hypothetical protein MAR_011463 [Mya arenaria]
MFYNELSGKLPGNFMPMHTSQYMGEKNIIFILVLIKSFLSVA